MILKRAEKHAASRFPCPDAYLLYTIKNAKSAKKGEVPLYQVGISSKDAKTLVVELEAPEPFFLQSVASSVFLPVNYQFDSKEPDWHVRGFAISPLGHIISIGSP